MYAKLGNDEHDRGFVPFTILKKEAIASGPIYLLKIERQDSGKLFKYHPGQYITLRVDKGGVLHHGHYSLLEPYNGQTYSVALKQGNDFDQNSIVSDEIIRKRAVGSTVLVSPPAGKFSLVKDGNHHLFISGGIGIASFMALIEELNQQGKLASATVVQCARTDNHAAFAATLHKLLPKEQYVILTQNEPISKNHLEGKLRSETHVYVSGSEAFLTMAENALARFNHPKSQIHMKSIEPTLRLLHELEQK
ncbi:unnamed protein product [Rotaria sordida]|uniref:FAD-binding FR-type domain-containing protein n=1 Tax=Rotaria sordida TaxID=392033 RepID=A0A819UEY1_9BILA|nr:unnamed protein product [Rotaria sordida]CAF4093658.1 unnamed protein product [Rotaria sordida]